jgi:hypothetical protein
MDSTRKEITSKLDSELYSKISSELRSVFVKNNPPKYAQVFNPIFFNELGSELYTEINQMINNG